jgi:hypothetical protein
VGFLAMGYSILDAAVRASTISGMRVSRGFPVDINSKEIDDISSELRRKIRKIRNALY